VGAVIGVRINVHIWNIHILTYVHIYIYIWKNTINYIYIGCITALVGAVIGGRINTAKLAKSVCRCLCLLSYYAKSVEFMIVRGRGYTLYFYTSIYLYIHTHTYICILYISIHLFIYIHIHTYICLLCLLSYYAESVEFMIVRGNVIQAFNTVYCMMRFCTLSWPLTPTPLSPLNRPTLYYILAP
jgi:hypothetical protein